MKGVQVYIGKLSTGESDFKINTNTAGNRCWSLAHVPLSLWTIPCSHETTRSDSSRPGRSRMKWRTNDGQEPGFPFATPVAQDFQERRNRR